MVSVRGEGGGSSTVVARECCVWEGSVRDMLPCAVSFFGSSIGFCTLGVNFF